jgi:hypothetical protein
MTRAELPNAKQKDAMAGPEFRPGNGYIRLSS